MLQNYLFYQFENNSNSFIFKLDGSSPTVSRSRGIFKPKCSCTMDWPKWQSLTLLAPKVTWPHRFLWLFIKHTVYVPPLPIAMDELRNRIRAALEAVTQDCSAAVWNVEWIWLLHCHNYVVHLREVTGTSINRYKKRFQERVFYV